MLLNFYHPLRAFEEIAMLDQISGGRVELGIGRGASPVELGFFGVDASESQGRYLEATDIVLQAMAGGTLNYQGRYFDLKDIPISLAPLQQPRPPLWVGAMQPGTAVWAAEHGANIACVGSVDRVRAITDAYHARWKALAEPDATKPFVGMVRQIVIADSDGEARALAAPAYQRWFDTFTQLSRQRGLPLPPTPANTFEGARESGFSIAGTVTNVRKELDAQASNAGVNYLLCQIAFGDLPFEASRRTASAMASEIMPHFAPTLAEVLA
jgi:alkanesulfonate monooxygenase SsuD/methylene tetrahydromethanopterin reductase-like flavin-dependent oxidoreductase (luciferase family)